MSFLTIPGQEGLFRTIRTGKSGEEAQDRSPAENDDEEEEDDTQNVRLIPRCSPVPRKRGQSIIDENAEYIRIHLGIAAGKRVLFADTTGGELVDVKEFVAFDSDDEEASARWEEEEAKYRKPQREPTYTVLPEFRAPTGSALLQAVQAGKVEVEQMGPVEKEPLAVSGLIRVLNISFHKSVYIRSTMDGWLTYFDHPAEYVQGSHDGTTDQFSFKLSFAPPYTSHGSRIEFVVRYETSEGDYWANNSSMNYVVTLLLSYEDDAARAEVAARHIRGILKPPKTYSMQFDTDSEEEPEKEKDAEGSDAGTARPKAMCPVIIKPEIDIEVSVCPPGPPVPPDPEPPCADGTPSAHAALPGEPPARTSSSPPPHSDPSPVPCASESLQPSSRHHCGSESQTSERDVGRSPAAPPPASTPPPRPEPATRSHRGDEPPRSDDSAVSLPPTTAQVESTEKSVGDSGLERPGERVPSPGSEVTVASGQLTEEVSESPPESAAQSGTSTCRSLATETEEPAGAEGDAPPSPGLTETPPPSTGDTEASQGSAPRSASPPEEKENTPPAPPDTLIEPAGVRSDVSEARRDGSPDLMPAAVFMSGVVSLSVVLQEPGALFFIGLLLVLHRL